MSVVDLASPSLRNDAIGKITAYIADPKDEKITKTPVMVSILTGGKVAQSEINMDSLKIFDDLPVGIYEVRRGRVSFRAS